MRNAVITAVIFSWSEFRQAKVVFEAKHQLQTIGVAGPTNETGVRVCAQVAHGLAT